MSDLDGRWPSWVRLVISCAAMMCLQTTLAVTQCSKSFDPLLRVDCGSHGQTEALCLARGCCWDNSTTVWVEGSFPSTCMSGIASTPEKGVINTSMWSTHIPLNPPLQVFPTVDVTIQGYIHNGHKGGPGPCCGNNFSVTAVNVSDDGFDILVVRHGFLGWGQELLLAWKLGGAACPFPPFNPSPSPGPPPPPPVPPACFYSEPAAEVKTVYIVDADHLDVGYHGLVSDVVNRYYDIFWPRALQVAAELKQGNHTETYSYTTFSWLVSMFLSCPPNAGLHCPNATYRAQVLDAIDTGVLTWNAFPFNSELGAYDQSMVEFGVNHTHELDDMLNMSRKVVLPSRDVPGVTRSLIPIALKSGLLAINQSPNGAMDATNVPPAFIWKDGGMVTNASGVAGVSHPSQQEMLTMWWEGDCDTFCFRQYPGCDMAVSYDWRGEDSGPNVGSAGDILNLYAAARAKFPNAKIVAGSLDDVAIALSQPQCKNNLPVLEHEVGDTWSYGMPSDPSKVANVRAAIRHRSAWIEQEAIRRQDAAKKSSKSVLSGGTPFTWLSNFSRNLLKGFEHTWGLRYDACYGGSMGHPGIMYNATGYLNSVFHAVRADPNGYARKNCEISWTDQTNWAVSWANDAIEDASLKAAIQAEQSMILNPPVPNPVGEGFVVDSFSSTFTMGSYELEFSTVNAAIVGLTDTDGNSWADNDHPLGLFTYSLYTNAQMTQLRSDYCSNGCNPNEFGKPGMPLNDSVLASPNATSIFVKKDTHGKIIEILTLATMPSNLNMDYGAPSSVWCRISLNSSSPNANSPLSMEFTLINKTSTRFAEAGFITFRPIDTENRGTEWAMDKLGEWVSPLDVADGGSMGMHPVWSGLQYIRSIGKVFFRTIDAAVVKFGEKVPFPTPVHGSADLSNGAHYLLYDNFWNTNYVFWWPYGSDANNQHMLFRFALEFSP